MRLCVNDRCLKCRDFTIEIQSAYIKPLNAPGFNDHSVHCVYENDCGVPRAGGARGMERKAMLLSAPVCCHGCTAFDPYWTYSEDGESLTCWHEKICPVVKYSKDKKEASGRG